MREDRLAALEQAVALAFGNQTRLTTRQALAGDASTRSYERIWLSGSSAPKTAVVMWLADRGVSISSDELAVLPETLTELPYVNVYRFLQRIGVDVPLIYADCSSQGLLLLEDVGDLNLWETVSAASHEKEVIEWFCRAVDQLVALQLRGASQKSSECIAFQQNFDARLYLWECHHFLEWGLERRIRHPLPRAEQQALDEEFRVLADRLDAEKRFLAHRDYHAWNLFVQPPARLRVIDFQDALLATPAYDLATLLGDRDTPSVVTPLREEALLRYYLERWHQEGGPTLDAKEFIQTYRLCALQKALKVVGRFHYLAEAKQKPQYLRYIPATLRQIRRLLPFFPEFPAIATVIQRYFPE
ncbi:hypothetical protein HRbin30_00630 [bacterium HR30]|nr:hypothetical protein HRbin30_00630 [bacterium HR30]